MSAAMPMTADHQPFPIADFQAGLFSAKEPWLSPQSAWRELKNGRAYRGRLEKRKGYSRMSELGIAAATVNGADFLSRANNFAQYGTILVTADGRLDVVIPETVLFEWPDASAGTLQAKVAPIQYPLTDGNAEIGVDVVDYATGETKIGFYDAGLNTFSLDWSDHPDYTGPGANRGTMDCWAPNGDPCMGIYPFRDATGTEYLIAMDTDYVYVYDSTVGAFKQNTDSYTLTGTAADYFWAWPFDDYIMFTNGKDPVHKYTPGGSPEIEKIASEFDSGSSGDDLDTCLLVVRFKGRTVFLNTTENGTKFPRRARWSTAGAFETFDEFDFADAPSDIGDIRTAQFIGSRLFVGFDKGWMELVDTGDATDPFRWEPTTSRFGSIAKLTTIKDNDRLLSRSETGIQAIDPNGQYAVDADIPDRVLGFNATLGNLSAAARNASDRAFWWTYVDTGETTPQHILCAQYDEQNRLSWSRYDMAFNVFGEFEDEGGTTWDSLGPATWDSFSSVTWDSARAVAGFPRLLGGTSDGTVYTFDESDTDFGVPFQFFARSQRLSPYPGQKSHLGWIDVYASAADSVSISIGVVGDVASSIYKAQTIALDPAGSGDKVYRRILINRTATFHQIVIDATTSSFFAIDAIVPWFRPAGRIRAFG